MVVERPRDALVSRFVFNGEIALLAEGERLLDFVHFCRDLPPVEGGGLLGCHDCLLEDGREEKRRVREREEKEETAREQILL